MNKDFEGCLQGIWHDGGAQSLMSCVVQVTIDNCTSSNYSVVSIVCKDRKGLIYDLMRTLKDIHVRVAYAKIKVHGETAETDLFVEEADGQRTKERSAPSQQSHSLEPTPRK